MKAVRRLLSSPRRRRRLGATAITLGVLGTLTTIVVNLPNTSPRKFPEATEEGGTLVTEPRHVRMTARRRMAASRAIDGFVHHALLRQNPGAAWRLATPGLRSGSTRRQWQHGDLPVSPYPAGQFRRAGWSVSYSYPNVIGADVTVMPKLRSNGTIWVYSVELKDVLAGRKQRWLVDSWSPIKAIGGGTVAPEPKLTARERAAIRAREAAEERREARVERLTEESRLSRVWLLVPLAMFALILAVPLTLVLRSAMQTRRAERDYRSARRDR